MFISGSCLIDKVDAPHTDPEAGIGFSECQKGSEGSLELCEQYENRI